MFAICDSTGRHVVDIEKCLKTLPLKFSINNAQQNQFISFKTIKRALLGFQNETQDKIFKYFDAKSANWLKSMKNWSTDSVEIV